MFIFTTSTNPYHFSVPAKDPFHEQKCVYRENGDKTEIATAERDIDK